MISLIKVRDKPWVFILSLLVLSFAPLTTPRPVMAEEDESAYPREFSNLAYYRLNAAFAEAADMDETPTPDASGNTPSPDRGERKGSGSSPHLGSLHKYLGYATVLAAVGTLVSGAVAPENSVHPALAYMATGLGGATCTTGVLEYRDRLDIHEGLSTYNAHAALGFLSTIGFVAALAMADGEGHKVAGGIAGATFVLTVGVLYF